MFISKMNRLFHKHGRLAFGLLTLFIIIPFVLYFSVAPEEIMNMFSFGSAKSSISINGERISQKEFSNAMSSLMISMTSKGWPVDFNSSAVEKQLTANAIDRLIQLNEVNNLKIRANDVQLAEYMKSLPMFQSENGQFEYNRYKMVSYILERYGISQSQIESALRQDASINILKKLITNSVILTEGGLVDFYNTLNQKYLVKIALFNSKEFISKVTVNDKGLQEYFNSHAESYMTPEKSKAYIVKFALAAYKSNADNHITEGQINQTYEVNKVKYKGISEQEAKAKIKDQLIETLCASYAKSAAQEFAVNAYKLLEFEGKIDPKANSIFETLALKNHLDVYKTSTWISKESDLIENIGREPALVNQISALYPDQPITNAVEGKKAYFIALLTNRIEPHRAQFADVKGKVLEGFKASQALIIAREEANKFRERSLKMDKSKLDANKEFTKTISFSQSDFAEVMTDPNARAIIELAIKTPQGQISAPSNSPDGAFLVYVDKITLPEKKDFEKNKKNLETQYRNALEQIAWINYNLMLKRRANAFIYNSVQK